MRREIRRKIEYEGQERSTKLENKRKKVPHSDKQAIKGWKQS